MAKRHHKPTDPAEIARRKLPKGSEVPVAGLGLPSNKNVVVEGATRSRVARVTRCDAFALLHSRGSLTELQLAAVRRLEMDIAARFGVEGRRDTGVIVDCDAGSAEGTTLRQIQAVNRINEALALTGNLSACVLIALCEPAVQNGQPVNNWRGVVQRMTGEHLQHGQTAAVRMACENLAKAYVTIDNSTLKAA